MSHVNVEPAAKSWTTTKVVAVIVAILTAGYMLPWAIAAVRDVPHWSVFWVNLLLGWTVVGWIVAPVTTDGTRSSTSFFWSVGRSRIACALEEAQNGRRKPSPEKAMPVPPCMSTGVHGAVARL